MINEPKTNKAYALLIYSALGLALIFRIISTAHAAPLSTSCQLTLPLSRVTDGPVTTLDGQLFTELQITADPTVIYDERRYKMWFTTGDSQQHVGFAYAESGDGLRWKVWKNPAQPDLLLDLVFTNKPRSWYAAGAETASVLKGPDNLYRLYFTGDGPNQTYAIGLAVSRDGITWSEPVSAPVLAPVLGWEKPDCSNGECHTGGVLEPSVIYDAKDRLYKMWYAGLGKTADSFVAFRIGYATSPDGIKWQRLPDPVLDLGPLEAWDGIVVSHVNVTRDGAGTYHLFYFGQAYKDYQDGIELQRGSIGHAISQDGIHWVKDAAPLLTYRPGKWDGWMVGGPSALFMGNQLQLWYFGSMTGDLRTGIGMVSAACSPNKNQPLK